MHKNGFWKHSAETAAVATAVTTATLAAIGKRKGSAAGPVNAVSHIAWGEEARRKDEVSAKFTLVGGILNAMAVVGWAAVHEWFLRKTKLRNKTLGPVVTGAAVSALAYVTDYKVVPKRLTPGFEKRLSKEEMFIMYGVLAASLAIGAMAAMKHHGHHDGGEAT